MKIDATIDQWFRETVDKINTESKPVEPVYDLCSTVIPLAHNYCDAILLLLNKQKKLPAIALIRVIAELTLRFIWCLHPNTQGEDIDTRIQRWKKESYKQAKRNLEKRLPSADVEEKNTIGSHIECLNNEISQIPHKCAGDLYGSLETLVVSGSGTGGKCLSWKDDLYPLLYTPFNMAIHPDYSLFRLLEKQEGHIKTFSGDLDTADINVLKIYCMSCVFNIIAATRIVYEWDYQSIKEEYLSIKKQFKKQ